MIGTCRWYLVNSSRNFGNKRKGAHRRRRHSGLSSFVSSSHSFTPQRVPFCPKAHRSFLSIIAAIRVMRRLIAQALAVWVFLAHLNAALTVQPEAAASVSVVTWTSTYTDTVTSTITSTSALTTTATTCATKSYADPFFTSDGAWPLVGNWFQQWCFGCIFRVRHDHQLSKLRIVICMRVVMLSISNCL